MILYFSGTGNSKFIASVLGEETKQNVVSLNKLLKGNEKLSLKNEPSITVVCPIYAGRIPRIVENCIKNAHIPYGTKTYFITTCGDSMGNADSYLKKLCNAKQLDFYGTAEIKMPEGYIVMFTAPEDAAANCLITDGKNKAVSLAKIIENEQPLPDSKNKWSAMSHLLNPIFYKAFISAKGFYTKSNCVSCGTCVTTCPLNNINLKGDRPQWSNDCTHCMACISSCPTQAIEFHKKTADKKRYHCDHFISKKN